MERSSTAEASLLSKLESSVDLTGIRHLFIVHLQPFTPFLKPSTTTAKKPVKSSKSKPPDNPTSIRSLAKQFLSFIHKSLSLLPKRLSGSPKITEDSALELFDSYRLCLNCLDLIAPELAGKPYSVQLQRIRYIHCLEHWELYKEAEAEGFVVLESLSAIVRGGSKGNSRKSKARLVPELSEDSVDQEVAAVILEIVVTLVKCTSKRRSKVDADYWRVISLVNESEPWFKILDAKDYEKFHHFLETNLHITALFLVAEIKDFGVDLIHDFSIATFKEYKKSSAQDQIYKVALKICSSLFSQRDELSNDIILDVLKHVLDFMAAECQVGVEKTTLGFLDLVCYCAYKCHSAAASLCDPVAEHLYRVANALHKDFPHISSILRLYVTGLLASSSSNRSNGEDEEKYKNAPVGSALQVFLNKERLQQVAASINLLNGHFDIGGKGKNSQKREISHSPSYWEALKFLCQSLAEFIYVNRKEIFSDAEITSSWDDLSSIHDVFHQFCYTFLQCLSATERERETTGDNHRVISVVVVAALILSFKTNKNIKESTLLVKHVISTEWLPVKRLKYLYVSLNNMAVILNREKRLKEALKALKLCCKASWNYVVDLCKMHVDKSHASRDDMSEKAIADFAMEASEKVAFLLELNREGNCKIDGIIKECVKCWCVAENLIGMLPTPASLIKEWVKIQFLVSKEEDTELGTTLYSLLSSSEELPKSAIGKLLEEELLAYDEKSYVNPRYCLRMRMRIIDVLLEKVYITNSSNVKKSKILIEKAKVLRANGLARLDECVQCLSNAITTLNSIYSGKSCSSRVHNLLIHAYILRALWTQEAAPNSVVLSPRRLVFCIDDFVQDIYAALKFCLNPDHGHADEQYEDMLYLWYQLIDLLSIKGYLEIHPSLYDVVIKLFKGKNIPLVKTMSELWKTKRLTHTLCASPVNHMFLETFSKHQSRLCSSAEFWKTFEEEVKPLLIGFHDTNNEIKQAASDLISQVPLSSSSMFLSSNLYYDLSGRLISSGRMIEALTYAKEAHRLRSKLLQQKFEYSVQKMTEIFDESAEIIEKSYYGIQNFKVNDREVSQGSCDYEGCVLTPWNVLTCYLESTLQVGFVQEILGNASEAEMLLRWGRDVSQFQGLPLLEISFSSVLGKLYCKQKLWSMAEKEMSIAKKILADNCDAISCKKCAYMLEISVNQQFGDLFLSSPCSRELPSAKNLFMAKSLYRSALDKLNLSDWQSCYSISEEAGAKQVISREKSVSSRTINLLEMNDSLSNDKPENKAELRRSRRTKKELKPASQRQDMVCGHNRRVTRSTHRSLGETCEIGPGDRQIGSAAGLATESLSTTAAGLDHNAPNSESKCSAADFGSDITSLCNKMKCWHCFHSEAVDCNSLNNFIYMNWELVYRKLCLRLLISIGKFSGVCGNVHEAHEILLQSVSILFSKNSYCTKYSSDAVVFLMESIGKDFPGNLLAVERAALLYYICWFTLKSYPYHGTRKMCCELSCVGTLRIVSLLKLSFILSQEVPLLFQKISRLLAFIYVLSTSLKQFSLSPSEEGSVSQWASFFHQASVGSHLNQQTLSGILQKKQSQISTDSKDSSPKSVSTILDVPGSHRLAPESSEELEQFVLRFFQGLPSTPVICISLVAGADAGLLRELLHCSPTIRAWILLSHLSSDNSHVILLPVCKTLEEVSNDDTSSSSVVFNCKDFVKQWQCPWASSVIDEIAPVFRHILEGNYYSSSEYFLEYIRENTSLWWMHRNRLDERLCKFLQEMEDLWLGTWKYLLLGEWPDFNSLDSIQKNLFEDEDLLQLVLTKKCYVGLDSAASSKSSKEIQFLFKRMFDMSDNVDQLECMNRKPIILVLDFEVQLDDLKSLVPLTLSSCHAYSASINKVNQIIFLQMLPWENLPILRNKEVYRMPSVGSIFATLDRCCQNGEQFETKIPAFPFIDPLDSYYLLNPDGDLSRTQVEFENWFKDQNIEGKIGTVPTIEELTLALKNHDLFIYFGHGSGMQYIPGHEIQKLDSCAAGLLLGCSSDKDIDRFGKAMLNAWLRERSAASAKCAQCNEPVNNCNYTKCSHKPELDHSWDKPEMLVLLVFLLEHHQFVMVYPQG
ncbi:UNVERIFIED_CONTAM: Separase [Sesamum calycinum]|uniref:separase n=1 Tax=Sesamum calycinum TaxID=2727403 RepID=A0AAW2PPY2_9LAMI